MADDPEIPKSEADQLKQAQRAYGSTTASTTYSTRQAQSLQATGSPPPPQPPPPESFIRRVLEIAKERFLETFDHSIGLVFAILSIALTHLLLVLLFKGDHESLEYKALRFIIFSGEAILLLKFIWNALRGFPDKNE